MPAGRGPLDEPLARLQGLLVFLQTGAPVTAQQADQVVKAIEDAVPLMKKAQVKLATLQQQLADCQAAAPVGGTLPPAATAGATTPPADQTGQVYVSGPAAGAIALVSAVLGVGGGYALRGYIDHRKRHIAGEFQEGSSKRLRRTTEEEE